MPSDPNPPSHGVVNEALRLVLSPQERAYIEMRIAKAKRQLVWAFILPSAYLASLAGWHSAADDLTSYYQYASVFFVVTFFILFGVTFHLLLAGIVDWIMFARYRRDHRAFLNRYNRT